MFKFPLAMVIGVTAGVSAAHADTIIIQGTPSHAPAIVTHGPMPELPGISTDILANPAFHRLAQMCETLGLECDADRVTADGGIDPLWTPRHIADAEKRMNQLLEDRLERITELEEHFEALPVPGIGAIDPDRRLSELFGWHFAPVRPHVAPLVLPRPHALPPGFGQAFPTLPRVTVPHTVRPVLPRGGHDLSGFYHRLNTPAVIPHGIVPRHTFPWRSF